MHKIKSLENVIANESNWIITGSNAYLKIKFMFHYYNGNVSDVFQNSFVLNPGVNEHHTRQNGFLSCALCEK